jgi:hypothetical protein
MALAANPPDSTAPKPRTFACKNCGSPISVYPPDDVHCIASRDESYFLTVVESIGVCSKCSATTSLYWGKPVFYRPIILLVRRLRTLVQGLIGQAIQRGGGIGRRGRPEAETAEPLEMSEDEKQDVQARVQDYIMENEGAIGLNKASEDLGLPVEFIKEAIQALARDGKLKQTSDNEATESPQIAA